MAVVGPRLQSHSARVDVTPIASATPLCAPVHRAQAFVGGAPVVEVAECAVTEVARECSGKSAVVNALHTRGERPGELLYEGVQFEERVGMDQHVEHLRE